MHPTFLAGRRLPSSPRAKTRSRVRARAYRCACVRACLSFFRNRRRVGGAKLGDAEEGRRPVINGTRETAFLESLLVLLFAAQRRDERASWRTGLVSEVTLAFEGARKEGIPGSAIPNRAIEFDVRKGRRIQKGPRRKRELSSRSCARSWSAVN